MYKWFDEYKTSAAQFLTKKAKPLIAEKNSIAVKAFCKEYSKLRVRRMRQLERTEFIVPSTSEKHIGIELEFCYPSDNEAKMMEALSPYADYLSATYDGSVRTDFRLENCEGCTRVGQVDCGHECDLDNTEDDTDNQMELKVIFPVSQPQILQGVCDVLKSYGAYVNKSCGLHVHIDMRDKTTGEVEEIGQKLVKVQNTFKEILPLDRHDNRFAKFVASSINDQNHNDRYKAINIGLAYRKCRTIEVRCYQGTIDYNEIWSWTYFLISIVAAKDILRYRKIKNLQKALKLPKDINDFITQNIKQQAA